MHLRISIFWSCAILVGFAIGQENTSNAVTGKSGSTGTSNGQYWPRDEFFIDDLEGSGGGRGEVRDDLESSGSGFGPDDEDGEIGSGSVPPVDNDHATVESNRDANRNEVRQGSSDSGTKIITDDENESIDRGNGQQGVDLDNSDGNHSSEDVLIMNPKQEDRPTSFFAQPGILAAVIGGAVVGLLCAILVVMFIVYRMRKKDEGSYALDEPKRSSTVNSYAKGSNREFYA